MKLTQHFTLKEFTDSTTAKRLNINNKPTIEHIQNLKRLCEKLELIRAGLDTQIKITSGYRSPKLNQAVGGVATSKHTEGNAADIQVHYISLQKVMDYCIKNKDKINYDKIIHETGKDGETWIHIQQQNDETKNRRQALNATYNHKTNLMEYTNA